MKHTMNLKLMNVNIVLSVISIKMNFVTLYLRQVGPELYKLSHQHDEILSYFSVFVKILFISHRDKLLIIFVSIAFRLK